MHLIRVFYIFKVTVAALTSICTGKVVQHTDLSGIHDADVKKSADAIKIKAISVTHIAEVVKLADAHGSGPCGLTPVWVQLPPSAQGTKRRSDRPPFLFGDSAADLPAA